MNKNDTLPLTTSSNSSSSSDSKSKTSIIHQRTICQSLIMMIRNNRNKNKNNKKSQCLFMSSLLTVFMFMSMLMFVIMPTSSSSEFQKDEVRVDIIEANIDGPQVTKEYKYSSHVTLYIEDIVNNEKTPSGWSTRKVDGATIDKPFEFEPGVGLIQGWTDGVLQMKEGERAWLHVPSHLGYGSRPMGTPEGQFYIPANSNLLFDIEILGKVERAEL